MFAYLVDLLKRVFISSNQQCDTLNSLLKENIKKRSYSIS